MRCDAVPWDAPSEVWDRYDLVVIRSTWDYTSRVDEFLSWVDSRSRVANAADVVHWNHDKRYLAALHSVGLPVVPTRYDPDDLAPGTWVVKPTVSAGARHTMTGDAVEAMSAVGELRAAGRVAMVQPYLHGIDDRGETALMYLGGEYSHAVRKQPVLHNLRRSDGTYEPDVVAPRTPSTAELEVAEAALDAIPFDRASLLYARVDLIPGDDGEPVLLELELIEPSLFLAHDPRAPQRFADAIVAML